MELCMEIVWNCPSDGIQHSRIEEIDRIYVFLAGLYSKFDVVQWMEIARSREGILLSQRKYTIDLLAKTGMLGCRPTDTSIEFNVKLENSRDMVPVDKEKYHCLFMQAPYEDHMEAVNRIQRYFLVKVRDSGRLTNVLKLILIQTRQDLRKPTSRYYTFVWDNLVTWRNKKQGVVARSSTKVKYRAISKDLAP
ncbi:putative mitochondrial protein [Cucumis melo var. makuwa]|uniref:Mitochondrial protein n=1 Tax=Cucumis melo var. makuwa TaxID=1194695 RepID=A0A5A7STW9_CUCMM|nr:putative mitochondrial protein [Cucumis melo var. makuwa]